MGLLAADTAKMATLTARLQTLPMWNDSGSGTRRRPAPRPLRII